MKRNLQSFWRTFQLSALSLGTVHHRGENWALVLHHIKTRVTSPPESPKERKRLLRHQNYAHALVCTTVRISLFAVSRDS